MNLMTLNFRNLLIAVAVLSFVTVSLFAHGNLITTVVLVRHAEKTDDGRDPLLSPEGKQRAVLLARVLGEQRVAAIFATPFHRTRDTAAPIAELAGLEVIEIEPNESHAADLAARIAKQHMGETVVVVGHSNTVPAIIEALGVAEPPTIDHDGYDDLFVVIIGGDESRLIHLKYGESSQHADSLHEMSQDR